MLPLAQFNDYIKKNALFTTQDKILLAVSGGKDSVLMVQLFKLAGYQFSIAHCNFNLRGEESQRDEAFVKMLATVLEVPFYVTNFETAVYAEENHVSTQMAARTLRYQWFEKIRMAIDYDFIALAHHQNDSVETLLLNLVRGTGISGMHGILPKRDRLVRPLLCFTREQIEQWVTENNIDFVTDSSNESAKYARNNIRLNIIPQLRKINPNLEQTFSENISRFAQTEEVLQRVVLETRAKITTEINGSIYFSISEIKLLQPQQLLFFELVKPYHFSSAVTAEILNSLDKQSGTSFYSETHRATINRSQVIISENSSKKNLPIIFYATMQQVQLEHHRISVVYADSINFESNVKKAFVDQDSLIFPLVVRFKQDGDRFMPLGMQQYKKLSDFLIGQRIPLPEKDNIPLLINGNGEIIWVAGLRQDNRYKVNATTKKVAIFELSNQHGPEK
jgi:tRNA(Ile)-lysidine synthase